MNTSSSPKWGTATKIIVTLLILAAGIALLIRLSDLLSTLITGFIFSVLFQPIARFICNKTKISWAWSVSIVYLIAVVVILGMALLGGLGLINQVEGLIGFLQNLLVETPQFFEDLTAFQFSIGPFNFDLSYIDWDQIGDQLLTTIEPILTRIGTLIGNLASGAVGFLGSFLFSLFISYLATLDIKGIKERIAKIEIPGYQYDFVQLSSRINKIWNEFLRGQSLVFLIRFVLYLIILGVLDVRFVLGMAILATIGNFIPYIGVAIVWIIIFFVALFQGTTVFGLDPLPYALIVMGVGWISDNIYDSFFAPKIMANVLKLHPVAVMVGVLVGLDLFGVLGMFLAPPLLATVKVVGVYVERKLLDQDPWAEAIIQKPEERKTFFVRTVEKVTTGTKNLYNRIIDKVSGERKLVDQDPVADGTVQKPEEKKPFFARATTGAKNLYNRIVNGEVEEE